MTITHTAVKREDIPTMVKICDSKTSLAVDKAFSEMIAGPSIEDLIDSGKLHRPAIYQIKNNGGTK